MLYSIVADLQSRTVIIYLSHPNTPFWMYPVMSIPVEGLGNFIKGLENAVELISGKETTLPKCVSDFMRTLE